MYIPKDYRQNDAAEILRFLKSNNFGVLLSSSNNIITGTHLPFIINETDHNSFSLTSHLAAANPQLKNWTTQSNALVIFSGPHGYVSPALYEDKQNVPTWNYVAVHVYGNITIVQDFEAKKSILERSIAEFEAAYFEQWKTLDTKYRDKLIHGMTGLEMQVTRVDAKYKLSQNKPKSTQENVANHFKDVGNELGDYMSRD